MLLHTHSTLHTMNLLLPASVIFHPISVHPHAQIIHACHMKDACQNIQLFRCLCKTSIIPQTDLHVLCVPKYPPTISELITVVAGHYSSGGKGGTEQNNHQLWTYSFQPHNPGHDLRSPIAFMHWLAVGDIPMPQYTVIAIIGIVHYHIASIFLSR